jgi:hypothetical protein
VSFEAAQAATKSLAAVLGLNIPSSSAPASDETVEPSAKVAEEAKPNKVEMEGKSLLPSSLPVKDEMN